MTVPGGDSGEKAQEDPKQPPPNAGTHPRGPMGVSPSADLPPPGWTGQTPAQPGPNPPHDSPSSPASGYPPPDYASPAYPPPGYPPSSPPATGYGPPGYQDIPGYGGPSYPPALPPEYGQPSAGGYPPPGYPSSYAQQPETNTLAIAALVASLVGLLCLIGSIVGIVLGAVAINQIKQTREPGYGLAVAAIVVGAATLVVYLIFAITIRVH
jgi:hypothetical protein